MVNSFAQYVLLYEKGRHAQHCLPMREGFFASLKKGPVIKRKLSLASSCFPMLQCKMMWSIDDEVCIWQHTFLWEDIQLNTLNYYNGSMTKNYPYKFIHQLSNWCGVTNTVTTRQVETSKARLIRSYIFRKNNLYPNQQKINSKSINFGC